MPASGANHYRRARAGPSTAPGHARAATHARRAIRRAIRRARRAARRVTPVFERGYNNDFGCGYDACDGGLLGDAGAGA